MESGEILEKLKPILTEGLGINESKIVPDAKLVEDLGADSLDVVDLIAAAQDEFDIEIKDEDIEEIKTIDDIISCISRLVESNE